jgi:hypothetical protein
MNLARLVQDLDANIAIRQVINELARSLLQEHSVEAGLLPDVPR